MVARPTTTASLGSITGRGAWRNAVSRPRLGLAAVCCAVALLLLLIDALIHPRAAFDRRLMQEIQAIELPGLARAISYQEVLTDSSGAIAAWVVALTILATVR